MKKIVIGISLFVFSAGTAFSQAVAQGFDLSNYGVKIEPDKRVIMVLAALSAARTENEKGESVPVIRTNLSDQGNKFRELLTSDLAEMNPGLRQRISNFVLSHKRRNPNLNDEQLIAPFISMAYTLTPAPNLDDPVITSDLPGSLLDVLDFAPLVRDVYRTTNIGANLNDYVKQYQIAADTTMRPSARGMVSELLSYLHTRPRLLVIEKVKTETQKSGSKRSTIQQTELREKERSFVIVPELLAPKGYVNFINVRDDYFVVVPAETDLTNSEVRRAYLQFVIDPLVLSSSKDVESVRPAVKSLLDERRKIDPKTSPDVFLTISRSLVAAIDAKQIENFKNRVATDSARKKIAAMGGSDPTKKVAQDLDRFKKEIADETILRLSEDYEKGAILAFYFADQLAGVEASGTDIAASMREMILDIDAAKEAGRYDSFADARKRALALREEQKKNAALAPSFAENPVTKKLIEIQDVIKARNYAKAEIDLKQLLEQNPSEPRIFFNIGRLAAITAEQMTEPSNEAKQKDRFLEAKVAFENVLRIAAARDAEAKQKNDASRKVDPALVSLTYVSLGRIYEFYDDKGYAIGIYDAAIKLGDVAGGGYREALASKQRLLKDQ